MATAAGANSINSPNSIFYIMKKVFFFFVILFITASCSNKSESVISEGVVQANNLCPIQVDYLTTLDKVTYSGKTLSYYYSIEEEQCPMDVLDASLDALAENAVATMKLNASKELIDACKDVNAKIMFIYKGNQTGNSVSIEYNPTTDKTVLHHLDEQ